MLSIDHQQTVHGITVYRDFQDPNQYYYLPAEKVKIANNGKGIQFVAYIDGEVVESTEPEFNDDLNRTGGFLTLEVELGPDETEVEAVRQQLEAESGSVRLTQVPFKDGAVKLVMFGSTGGDANSAIKFTVAGSTKPSLIGKQTAVFSLQLGGREAQIMWNLLKNGSQTQVGIVYDLEYLAVMPAYHLEITVDFKATEEFWQHHIDADFNLDAGSLKIVSNNDIDLIMRDLVNRGTITIKQVDYTGTGSSGPLGSDDPSGMKLVRELMSPTLFDVTAIPREDYNVLGSTLPSQRDSEGGTTTPTTTSPRPTPTPTTSPTPTSPTPTNPTPPATNIGTATPTDTPVPTPTSTATPSPPSNDGGGDTPVPTPTTETPPRVTPTTPTSPRPTPTTTTSPTPTSPTPTNPTPTPTSPTPTNPTPTSPTPTNPGPNTPEKVATKISINAGYSLKHRSISQQMKRTYIFDKAEAKTQAYHPAGALSLEGTAFDATKQVMLVRLGEGPFKEIKLDVRAAFDFDEFQILQAIVHISYGFRNRQGDKTNPLHLHSITLSPTEPRTQIKFFVDPFGTMTFDYTVEFIHKPGSIIGTFETRISSRRFENVTERDIAVNISDHSPLIPLEIQPGNILFSNDGIQSVQVFVAPKKNTNGRTIIFKEGSSELKKFLIAPAVEDRYVYFKRQEFFFSEDSIQEEFDDQKDSQVIVNRPETRVLNISPILVNTAGLLSKAIVKVTYRNVEGEELMKALVLNAEATATQQTFAIIVEEEAPRIWRATTEFLLRNGDILEGLEREYRIEQPPISLESCGLKVLKISTLLEADTFSGNIAAVQVQLFENSGNGAPALETVLLRRSKIEDTVVLKGVDVGDPLSAVVNVMKKTGEDEVLNIVVPAGSQELLIPIRNI